MRRTFAVLISALVLFGAGAAGAAELVMFEADGCPFCLRWHREIGPIYPKTEEGQKAPLRRVKLGALPSDLKRIKNVRYAPTFVLVQCGREMGRIVGYQGDEFFWGELALILQNSKSKTC